MGWVSPPRDPVTGLSALVAALVGLVLGPAILRGRDLSALPRPVGLATTTVIAGLTLLFLVPHAEEHAGWWGVAAMALAAIVPTLWHRALERPALGWLGVGWALPALAAHAAIDGASLAFAHGHDAEALGLAIAIHKVPEGLLAHHVGRRMGGPRGGLLAVAGIAVATLAGFAAGGPLAPYAETTAVGIVEALVVGGLLHVLLEGLGVDGHSHDGDVTPPAWQDAAGVAVGVTAVAAFAATAW